MQKQAIARLLDEGKYAEEIAEEVGCNSAQVHSFNTRTYKLSQYNPAYDGAYTLTSNDKAAIKLNYKNEDGFGTQTQIAARYNCPLGQVTDIFLTKTAAAAGHDDETSMQDDTAVSGGAEHAKKAGRKIKRKQVSAAVASDNEEGEMDDFSAPLSESHKKQCNKYVIIDSDED